MIYIYKVPYFRRQAFIDNAARSFKRFLFEYSIEYVDNETIRVEILDRPNAHFEMELARNAMQRF